VVGGDGTDDDATWQVFIESDENDTVNGRIGHITTQNGVVFVYGTISIGINASGTTIATEWTDSLKTIVFPGGKVAEGWNNITYNLTNSGTVITESSMSYSGQGRKQSKIFFDTELDVDGANEEIDKLHPYVTGQAVLYSNEGGTQNIGLTNNTEYFIENVTTTSISLSTSRLNSFAGTSVNLTASGAGNGENHSLTLQPDTRPNLNIVGTNGAASFTSVNYVNFNTFDLTSESNFNSCLFIESQSLLLNDGNLTGCSIGSPSISEGEAFVNVTTFSELTGISDCSFTSSGKGHAIELDGTSGSATLSGNTFDNYKSDPSGSDGKGWEFNNETNVSAASDTVDYGSPHGITTGEPFFYEVQSSGNIGLTDGNLYYLQATDSTSFSFHETESAALTDSNRIAISPLGTGLGGTNSVYSANCAFHNSTGGSLTLNISGGDSPGVRNSNGSTTTVVNSVSVTVGSLKDDSEVRVYETGTTIEVAGTENATDGTTDDRTFTFSDSPGDNVDIVVLALKYNWLKLINVTIPNDNATIPIQQIIDRNYIQ
jgi:hypothetical protein